jgi:nucleotide sugar dehydrogenase
MMLKTSILGLGYVGLPLALALERSQTYQVLGFDISAPRVQAIQDKTLLIEDQSAQKDLQELPLTVSSDSEALTDSDYFIICVPGLHNPDLKPLISALKLVAGHLQPGNTVIIESTINPGVCEEVALPLLEQETGLKGGQDFELAHCPERINPGDSAWNVYNIPRNVGALTKEGTTRVADFYRSFLQAEVNEMGSLKEAEATKIVENTFRDINIAYVNELAVSFDILGINLIKVI